MVAPTIFRQGQMAVPILRQLGFPTSVTNSSHKKSSNGSLKDNLLEQPVISKMVLTDRLPAFCGMQFDFLGFSMFFLHEIPSFLGTRPGSYFSIRTVSLFFVKSPVLFISSGNSRLSFPAASAAQFKNKC